MFDLLHTLRKTFVQYDLTLNHTVVAYPAYTPFPAQFHVLQHGLHAIVMYTHTRDHLHSIANYALPQG